MREMILAGPKCFGHDMIVTLGKLTKLVERDFTILTVHSTEGYG
jgi:hypothetical protein